MVWSQLAVPGDAPRLDDANDGEEDEHGEMHPKCKTIVCPQLAILRDAGAFLLSREALILS